MAGWDGQGLPPAVAHRAARFDGSRSKTSLLTAPDTASLEAVGFDPVGDVMGCTVQRISRPLGVGVTLDYREYAAAQRRGYELAMQRLMAEAARIGADGVLGIDMTVERETQNIEEFVALGTAVRARSAHRPRRPFTTGLPGPDVAKLLLSGWVPVGFVFGVTIQTRYLDYGTRRDLAMLAGNYEIRACTELVAQARSAARKEFTARVSGASADGAVVSSMSVDAWAAQESWLVAQAEVFGTAIARFSPGAPTRGLTMMPLNAGRSTP
ncbi:heavy metal-binding domain-containing protein [Amycolatopsis taiwanensis]|uniref:heavy metal-binding domain-containing protein n=1 Tax=Amycolatopsis taiwanensis TaxID=342230 RepID=UPI0004AE947C|nr:heavy metal-binding domain-containing protein [Amycolatopsis taiwanensis]